MYSVNKCKNGAVIPTFDQIRAVNLGGNIVFSEPINPEGLVGQVYLAADRSGTNTNNNVYMLASVQPAGSTNGSDVMFARSTDGGNTFSPPRRINDDQVNQTKWHWFGTLSAAANGRIDVVWFDTRNAANNTDSQLFYSYSIDGGTNWSANIAVSNSFNPFLGYPNQDKIGDYISVVSDNAGASVAYAATFNGEEDIYYVRIPFTSVATGPATPRAVLADFNDDSHVDFVIQEATTHETVVGYLDNTVVIGAAFGPTLPPGWRLGGAADFDGDGHTDYALFNPATGQTVIAYLSGLTVIGAAYGPSLPAGWELVATGDFNGDGHPDYVLYNLASGQTAIGYLNDTVVVNAALGPIVPVGWSLLVAP